MTQLDRIETTVAAMDAKLDGYMERLTVVETNLRNAKWALNWLAGILASAIIMALGALVSAFSSKP